MSADNIRLRLVKLAQQARALVESEKESGHRYIEVEACPARPPVAESAPPAPHPSASPKNASAISDDAARQALQDIASRISKCRLCELADTRTRTVPGQGAVRPDIMFIGEGPGEEEDKQGLAFVGRAGQLLTRIIEAMGFTREEVFIGNIVKCRPPGNRTPYPHEMETCMPFLEEQIAILRPRIIVALGSTAVRGLLHTETGITKLRGQWMEFKGIPVMPTFHPAYLLRNESGKKYVWADMKAVLTRLGRTPPRR